MALNVFFKTVFIRMHNKNQIISIQAKELIYYAWCPQPHSVDSKYKNKISNFNVN